MLFVITQLYNSMDEESLSGKAEEFIREAAGSLLVVSRDQESYSAPQLVVSRDQESYSIPWLVASRDQES